MADIVVTLPKPLEEVEGYSVLPPGVYEAELINAEKKVGPSGSDFINYTIQLYDKEKPVGRCFEVISLSENALWKLKGLLTALGIKDPKGKKLNISHTLNRRFLAEVVIGEFDKKKRNEMVDYFPIGQKKVSPEAETTESISEEEISFE